MSQYVFGGPASAGSGGLSGHGSGGLSGHGSSGSSGVLSPAAATGLEYTFLTFLIVLAIAGVLALAALRTYPRDLATAAASAENIARAGRETDPPPGAGPATADVG